MRRMRPEGGAAVVREDAITKVPALTPAVYNPWAVIYAVRARPWLSLEPFCARVNNDGIRIWARPADAGLVFSEKFPGIFNKADDNHDGRPGQTGEKQHFKDAHSEDRKGHAEIVARNQGSGGDSRFQASTRHCLFHLRGRNPAHPLDARAHPAQLLLDALVPAIHVVHAVQHRRPIRHQRRQHQARRRP